MAPPNRLKGDRNSSAHVTLDVAVRCKIVLCGPKCETHSVRYEFAAELGDQMSASRGFVDGPAARATYEKMWTAWLVGNTHRSLKTVLRGHKSA